MRKFTTISRAALFAMVACACLSVSSPAQEVDSSGNPLRNNGVPDTLRVPPSLAPSARVKKNDKAVGQPNGVVDADSATSPQKSGRFNDKTVEQSVQSFQSAFMRAYGEITPESNDRKAKRTTVENTDGPDLRLAQRSTVYDQKPIPAKASRSQDQVQESVDSTVFLMNSSSLVLPRLESEPALKDLPKFESGQADSRESPSSENSTNIQHPMDRNWAVDPEPNKNTEFNNDPSFREIGPNRGSRNETAKANEPRVAQRQDENFPQQFPDADRDHWNSLDAHSADEIVISDPAIVEDSRDLTSFNGSDANDFVADQSERYQQDRELPQRQTPVVGSEENTFRLPANQQEFPVLTDAEPNLPLANSSSTKIRNPAALAPPTFGANEDMDKFWWKQQVAKALHSENQTELTNPNSLIYDALKNSPRIRAISQEPLLRELQVIEAESAFDSNLYLKSQFDDRVDPVGNTLTTGGAPFLLDHIFSGEAGVRRKLVTGGELDLGQRIGFQNSNSRFFVPQDQGTATLALNFSQPLLRGRGRYYNQSQILIAQSTGGVAWSAFQTQLQDELERVAKAYWRLYYDRSVFLQKRRNVLRGEKILALLQGRRELDSLPSQIARARSAVTSRKAELANAFRDVRNAETEIRRRIADPNWLANQQVELLPVEAAQKTINTRSLEQIVHTALDNRPEIREAMQRAKIAAVQYDVSTNELLPELSLLLNTYVSALEGDSGVEVALTRQFSTTPGYSVGLNFEFPINNRAARSRVQQRHVQKVKIQADLDASIQTVIAESQIANRGLVSALQTMDAAEGAIDAAQMDLIQNRRRWDAFAFVNGDIADGQTPTTILDQLLDSQDRLASAELVYAQAELELKLAEIELQRAMGTLLISKQIGYSKTTGLGQRPEMILDMDSAQGEPNNEAEFPLPQPTYDSIRQ